MLGQFISTEGKKFNIIILAGGNGTRMGVASDYIPKALTELGNKRAIDYLIDKLSPIAHKFIVGVHHHSNLLRMYISARYGNNPIPIEFSEEDELISNATSFMYCLDHADSKYGTVVTFCDLLIMNSFDITGDQLFIVNHKASEGVIGTFRHGLQTSNFGADYIQKYDTPIDLSIIENGILGFFTFNNTIALKAITYREFLSVNDKTKFDITTNIVSPYHRDFRTMKVYLVKKVYEFGNENDLKKVRELWEKI